MEEKEVLRINNGTTLSVVDSHKLLLEFKEDFIIHQGDIIIFHGNNASGKSSLLKALFATNDEGNYLEGSEDFGNLDSRIPLRKKGYDMDLVKKVCYIEQERHPWIFKSVLKSFLNPLLQAKGYTLSRKQLKEEAKKVIDEFFPESKKDNMFYYRRESSLSGGQRKMLSVLSGLFKAKYSDNCILLALDEPLNFLDPNNKKKVVDAIEKLKEDKPSMSFMIVTHCLVFRKFLKDSACHVYTINQANLEELENKIDSDSSLFVPCLESKLNCSGDC